MKTITKTIFIIALAIGGLFSTNGIACTTAPATPGVISGPSSVCLMSTVTYTIDTVTGATSYTWTVPFNVTGLTISSGQGTTSITCHVSAGTVSGNVTCTATNSCGTSSATTLAIDKKPSVPGVITTNLTCGGTAATFSIAPVQGAGIYSWSVPTGMTITSGTGTTSIDVSILPSFGFGALHVASVNSCGSLPGFGSSMVLESKAPASPAPIAGPANVCGSTSFTYSTAGSPGSSSYIWAITGNASVSGSTGLTTTVTFLSNFTTGVLSVVGVNDCGTSPQKSLALSGLEPTPGPITVSPNVFCAGQAISISTTGSLGATSYQWQIPGTASFLAANNGATVSVQWGVGSGSVSVRAIGACVTSSPTSSLMGASCLMTNNNNYDKSLVSVSGGDIAFNMYPNPAQSEFTIDVTTSFDNNVVVEVYDITGNKVIQQKRSVTTGESSLKTNIEEFHTGMYFVRILDTDNNILFHQTIIKQ